MENHTIKALIVDDDEINIFLTQSILQQLLPNSKVLLANNGLQAIELYKKEKPSIIFMDVQMPEMNGTEATIEIRKIEIDSRIPIVALSAGSDAEDIEKCISAGMNDYIIKPVKKSSLDTVMHKWIK